MKLAIVGGGASGLAAAIEAKRTDPGAEVTILERLDRVGRKILATGNGRCNYSNVRADSNNYYGQDSHFADHVLREFTVDDTVNFFNHLGVFPKEEKDGRLYPFSLQASSVLDALRNACSELGVNIITGFYVRDIAHKKNSFVLSSSDGKKVYSDRVIIAGGGCASPSLGSDGSAFDLLRKMGHTITKLSPALVQLRTDPEEVKSLRGIKFTGSVCLIHGDNIIAEDYGEVLFTEYGVSGPPVFQLSAKIPFMKDISLSLDFMSEYTPKEVYDILEDRRNSLSHLTMENFFTGLLNKRIGNRICSRAGLRKLSYPVKDLTRQQLWAMVSQIKDYRLEVTGTNGFRNAQVTAGGAKTSEFDSKTLQSRLVKGLYACGEVLDIYGDCGGYNLQWAWSSGRLAGRFAVSGE